MANKKNKIGVIGVIGGMGPYATLEFCKKIFDLSVVQDQSEHLRLCIDINPAIPHRTRAVFEDGESPVSEIVNMTKRLLDQEVDVIVMPCNNATYFLPEILMQVDANFISIIEATVSSLDPCKTKKVAVLGTYITYYKKTYKNLIEKNNFEYIDYPEELFFQVEKAIQLIRDFGYSKKSNSLIQEVILELVNLGVDTVILGCTELGLVNISTQKSGVNVIDSSHELARLVVLRYK